MHARTVVLAVVVALVAALLPGCKSVDCGPGTTERSGTCVPASEAVGNALCGPFTELRGGQCAPIFPPTMCDPATTQEDTDSAGVTTCVGTGGGGCAARLACPTPSDGTQTICGQIYDFETSEPFAAAGATGAECTAAATNGPCSLGILAFDAAQLATDPTHPMPLSTDPVYIDDCGRYRVSRIAQPAGPFVALSIDDASQGPGGTTNTVGVATTKGANTATKDFEAFIVRGSTTASWGATPSLAAGIYAQVFRAHRTGFDPAPGVTFTFGPTGMPPQYPTMMRTDRDFYFTAGSTSRTTLDAGASATTTNGTALVTGANLGEVYAGAGGIPATCLWEVHAGAAIPNAIFIQIFRPMDAPGQTCTL
ncbi:MAG TPA: hypothetical protein VFT22_45040 [Kofleriaceae bacterium]|nr:hypothetical protein [Kofleriaceae bacterium]